MYTHFQDLAQFPLIRIGTTYIQRHSQDMTDAGAQHMHGHTSFVTTSLQSAEAARGLGTCYQAHREGGGEGGSAGDTSPGPPNFKGPHEAFIFVIFTIQ